jgi:hypothetical protein
VSSSTVQRRSDLQISRGDPESPERDKRSILRFAITSMIDGRYQHKETRFKAEEGESRELISKLLGGNVALIAESKQQVQIPSGHLSRSYVPFRTGEEPTWGSSEKFEESLSGNDVRHSGWSRHRFRRKESRFVTGSNVLKAPISRFAGDNITLNAETKQQQVQSSLSTPLREDSNEREYWEFTKSLYGNDVRRPGWSRHRFRHKETRSATGLNVLRAQIQKSSGGNIALNAGIEKQQVQSPRSAPSRDDPSDWRG